MKLYVEGGGDANTLRTARRSGFSEFLQKAGLKGKMPRIVACGSRRDAYDSFCTAIETGEEAFLLVDSEAPVDDKHRTGNADTWRPWAHLGDREGDKWAKPQGCDDDQCHLMVQCMESWFLADAQTLTSFFGQGFQSNRLPAVTDNVESVSKQRVYDGLAKAIANCKTKSPYGKGEHSFKILALIEPEKVVDKSPWASRFVEELKKKMGVDG